MKRTTLEKSFLIGLALPRQTSNQNNQAATDCGMLWQEYLSRQITSQIPGKIGDEVYAVYHNYEGDHTQPYSYFIGCAVSPGTAAPDGLDSLSLVAGNYLEITAKGKMPDCVANAWRDIWNSDHPRTYGTDFEVYGEKSADWQNAEVDIYLGVQ